MNQTSASKRVGRPTNAERFARLAVLRSRTAEQESLYQELGIKTGKIKPQAKVKREVKFRINKAINGIDNSATSLYESPTGNCQLSSIKHANNALCRVTSKEDFDELMSCFAQMGRAIKFIDVKQNYAAIIDKYINKRSIIAKTPYVSTNGSEMCIYLLKLNNYIKR